VRVLKRAYLPSPWEKTGQGRVYIEERKKNGVIVDRKNKEVLLERRLTGAFRENETGGKK